MKENGAAAGKPDIHSLYKGCTFKYGYSTWTVLEAYEYDWGEDFFSVVYKVDDGQQLRYLSVEEDDDLELAFYEALTREEFEKSLPRPLQDGEEMPESLFYNGRGFFLEEESPGYCRDLSETDGDWDEMVSWDYYDKTEKYSLCIEQWGENDFEVYFGELVEAYEVRDITVG